MGKMARAFSLSALLALVLLLDASAAAARHGGPGALKNASPEAYHPPSLTLSEVEEMAPSALETVAEAFVDQGMLLVLETTGRYGDARIRTLAELEKCASSFARSTAGGDESGVRISTLGDGTSRFTIATSSEGGASEDDGEGIHPNVVANCPDFSSASSAMRRMNLEATQAVARSLRHALLAKFGKERDASSPSCEGVDILAAVQAGDHLEHFHVYTRKGEERDDKGSQSSQEGAGEYSAATLHMHTDLGVLLSMAPALYTTGKGDRVNHAASGLFVETKAGSVKQVHLPQDGILFMVGEGVRMWLSHDLDQEIDFHIPKHAMAMPEGVLDTVSRSWYGRMIMPPAHATLKGEKVSFETFREVAKRRLQGARKEGDEDIVDALQNVGCSHGRTLMEGLSVPGHSKEDDCGDGTVYCWMQCMPTKDLNCTKDEIKCADSQGKIWKKETAEMCPECQLRCEAPPTATNKVCNPNFTPVSMYMSGFTWGFDANEPCLVYLFQGITLDTQWKFILACFVTAALGVLADFGCVAREGVRLRAIASRSGARNVALEGLGIFLFTTQAFLSYALMLVAMTYKGELLCSLLVGLAIGYFFFKKGSPAASPELCCNLTNDTVSTGKAEKQGHAQSTRKEITLSRSQEMRNSSPLLSTSEKDNMMESNPSSSPSREGTFRDTLRCCQDN